MSPKGKKGNYEEPGIYADGATKGCPSEVTCKTILCAYCKVKFKCNEKYDPDTGVAATSALSGMEAMKRNCKTPRYEVCTGTYCEKEYCPPGMTYVKS